MDCGKGPPGAEFSPDERHLFVWHGGSKGGLAVIDIGNLQGGLVFASNRAGEDYQIYRMPPGRKEAVRLTRNHATDRCPRWSPDGRRIAYLSTEAGLPKICITDYRGSRPTI